MNVESENENSSGMRENEKRKFKHMYIYLAPRTPYVYCEGSPDEGQMRSKEGMKRSLHKINNKFGDRFNYMKNLLGR